MTTREHTARIHSRSFTNLDCLDCIFHLEETAFGGEGVHTAVVPGAAKKGRVEMRVPEGGMSQVSGRGDDFDRLNRHR